MIDLSGRLVGISSAKMAFTPQGVPTQGLGFAIPAEVVRDSVADSKKSPRNSPNQRASLRPPPIHPISSAEKFFGLQLQDLNQELTDALGYLRGRGVLISAVEPESPADHAGIERGLVIYRVGQIRNEFRQTDRGLASRGCKAAQKLISQSASSAAEDKTSSSSTVSMTAR